MIRERNDVTVSYAGTKRVLWNRTEIFGTRVRRKKERKQQADRARREK